MKRTFLPAIIIAAVLWSCASAYKNTSTPDDVYYSPSRTVKDKAVDEYTGNSEDNYLHMKVHNRYQWDAIDDYSYWNDARYDFGYSCFPSREVMMNPYNPYMGIGFGMYYSPWYNWNSPYTTVVYYKNPKVYYGNTGKSYLTAYRNPMFNNNNKPTFGSLFKQAFSNNYNNSNSYTPYNNSSSTRTFSSGSSSSAGGMSGGFHSAGSSAGGGRGPR
jgi:hypothetical protein